MIQEEIRPHFYYNCEGELLTLDAKYSPSGSMIAFSFSNGSISIYPSSRHLDPEEAQKNSIYNYTDPDNLFLKLTWSYNERDILAGASISKALCVFKITKDKMQKIHSRETELIPLFLCYYPSPSANLISVGFTGGAISLYDSQLECLSTVALHKESVNWLNWESSLYESQRNRWATQYYGHQMKNTAPLLISCSSDKLIKVWMLDDKKLNEIYSIKAHIKPIRQVMWKPRLFKGDKKIFTSCSEDGNVKFWSLQIKNENVNINQICFRGFDGPVYRAEYNHLGTLIAIRYYKTKQQKIETQIFKQVDGLLKEEVSMNEDESPEL